jgi:hypothetical protein
MVSGARRLLMAGLGLTITVGLVLLLAVPRGSTALGVSEPETEVGPARSGVAPSGPATEPEAGSRPADAPAQRVAVAADSPRDLAVRVRTSFGAPAADMPVRFVWLSASVLKERFTGLDGCAAVRPAELPPGGGALRAEVACVGQSAVTAWLAPRDWPAEPLVLDLPPLVTVRVAVNDPDGLPARDPGRVRLDCLRNGQRFASVNEAYAAGEAMASFRRVPADVALEVRALEGAQERAFLRLGGPFAAGTEVHAALRRTLPTCVLVGRLVDASGKPLNGQVFTVSLFPSGGERIEEEARTGDKGEFRVPLARTWQGHPLDRVLFSIATSVRLGLQDTPAAHERLARLALPGHIEERVQDVGGVTMRGLEPLASGELVYEEGNPLERPFFYLELSHGRTNAPTPEVFAARDPLDAILLRGASSLGRFWVHGLELPASTWITARGTHRAAAPLLLRPGANDHRLVLVSSRLIQMTARVDPQDAPSFWLRPRFDGTPQPCSQINQEAAALGLVTAFWADVPPGRYALLFCRRPGAAPEIALDDLAIEPGSLCRDPRLQSLDLRSSSKR